MSSSGVDADDRPLACRRCASEGVSPPYVLPSLSRADYLAFLEHLRTVHGEFRRRPS